MRPTSIHTMAFACVALLCVQISGLHLHVSVQGDGVGQHGPHFHHVDQDGLDHSDDIEVSVLELGTTWSKIVPLVTPLLPWLLAVVWILHTLWPPPVGRLLIRRRPRWRPPLRAPPISL